MLSTMRDFGLVVRATRLPDGAFRWSGSPPGHGLIARLRRWLAPPGPVTAFHVTHPGAGSGWVGRVLRTLAPDRLVAPEPDAAQFLDRPLEPGKVYPAVCVTRQQFQAARLPPNSRWFVVVRDLRDTLVSAYLRIRDGRVGGPEEERLHAEMADRGTEAGLLRLLDGWLPGPAAVQRSWAGGSGDVIRYEDLLERDEEVLARVLLWHCRLGVDPWRFHEAVRANRPEARPEPQPDDGDDPFSPVRIHAPGWQTHFTDRVTRAFKARFGDLLVATGYERDDRW